MMKKIAVIGTQGLPAHYGGFETLVENIIGENCSSDVEYTVFCSKKDCPKQLAVYKGAKLKYIPVFHANGVQSIPYDMLSLIRSIKGYDVVLILGVSGCLFLPIFRLFFRKKLIVNIDGLEHRRAKWGKFAKRFLRVSEAIAVRLADVVIADNKGIQDYVREIYHREAEMIAYGGDHVLQTVCEEKQNSLLQQWKLEKQQYAMSICRIEPENNCHLILEAFAKQGKHPLVFIGNWEKSDYGRELQKKYAAYGNIHLVGAIYDLELLYTFRKNCRCYLHGHSAGGTNPSLVEAMFFEIPIIAYDVIYNRETTRNKALFFKNVEQLVAISMEKQEVLEANAKAIKEVAEKEYTWKKIAQQYEAYY